MAERLRPTAADDLRASQVVRFGTADYKVKSVRVNSGAGSVEVVYHDTNDGQPYWYELADVLMVVV